MYFSTVNIAHSYDVSCYSNTRYLMKILIKLVPIFLMKYSKFPAII